MVSSTDINTLLADFQENLDSIKLSIVSNVSAKSKMIAKQIDAAMGALAEVVQNTSLTTMVKLLTLKGFLIKKALTRAKEIFGIIFDITNYIGENYAQLLLFEAAYKKLRIAIAGIAWILTGAHMLQMLGLPSLFPIVIIKAYGFIAKQIIKTLASIIETINNIGIENLQNVVGCLQAFKLAVKELAGIMLQFLKASIVAKVAKGALGSLFGFLWEFAKLSVMAWATSGITVRGSKALVMIINGYTEVVRSFEVGVKDSLGFLFKVKVATFSLSSLLSFTVEMLKSVTLAAISHTLIVKGLQALKMIIDYYCEVVRALVISVKESLGFLLKMKFATSAASTLLPFTVALFKNTILAAILKSPIIYGLDALIKIIGKFQELVASFTTPFKDIMKFSIKARFSAISAEWLIKFVSAATKLGFKTILGSIFILKGMPLLKKSIELFLDAIFVFDVGFFKLWKIMLNLKRVNKNKSSIFDLADMIIDLGWRIIWRGGVIASIGLGILIKASLSLMEFMKFAVMMNRHSAEIAGSKPALTALLGTLDVWMEYINSTEDKGYNLWTMVKNAGYVVAAIIAMLPAGYLIAANSAMFIVAGLTSKYIPYFTRAITKLVALHKEVLVNATIAEIKSASEIILAVVKNTRDYFTTMAEVVEKVKDFSAAQYLALLMSAGAVFQVVVTSIPMYYLVKKLNVDVKVFDVISAIIDNFAKVTPKVTELGAKSLDVSMFLSLVMSLGAITEVITGYVTLDKELRLYKNGTETEAKLISISENFAKVAPKITEIGAKSLDVSMFLNLVMTLGAMTEVITGYITFDKELLIYKNGTETEAKLIGITDNMIAISERLSKLQSFNFDVMLYLTIVEIIGSVKEMILGLFSIQCLLGKATIEDTTGANILKLMDLTNDMSKKLVEFQKNAFDIVSIFNIATSTFAATFGIVAESIRLTEYVSTGDSLTEENYKLIKTALMHSVANALILSSLTSIGVGFDTVKKSSCVIVSINFLIKGLVSIADYMEQSAKNLTTGNLFRIEKVIYSAKLMAGTLLDISKLKLDGKLYAGIRVIITVIDYIINKMDDLCKKISKSKYLSEFSKSGKSLLIIHACIKAYGSMAESLGSVSKLTMLFSPLLFLGSAVVLGTISLIIWAFSKIAKMSKKIAAKDLLKTIGVIGCFALITTLMIPFIALSPLFIWSGTDMAEGAFFIMLAVTEIMLGFAVIGKIISELKVNPLKTAAMMVGCLLCLVAASLLLIPITLIASLIPNSAYLNIGIMMLAMTGIMFAMAGIGWLLWKLGAIKYLLLTNVIIVLTMGCLAIASLGLLATALVAKMFTPDDALNLLIMIGAITGVVLLLTLAGIALSFLGGLPFLLIGCGALLIVSGTLLITSLMLLGVAKVVTAVGEMDTATLEKAPKNFRLIMDAYFGMLSSIVTAFSESDLGLFDAAKALLMLGIIRRSVEPIAMIMDVISKMASLTVDDYSSGSKVVRNLTDADIKNSLTNIGRIISTYCGKDGIMTQISQIETTFNSSGGSQWWNPFQKSDQEQAIDLLRRSVRPITEIVDLIQKMANMTFDDYSSGRKVTRNFRWGQDDRSALANLGNIMSTYSQIVRTVTCGDGVIKLTYADRDSWNPFADSDQENVLELLEKSTTPISAVVDIIQKMANMSFDDYSSGKKVTRNFKWGEDDAKAMSNLGLLMNSYSKIVSSLAADGDLLKSTEGGFLWSKNDGEKVFALLKCSTEPIVSVVDMIKGIAATTYKRADGEEVALDRTGITLAMRNVKDIMNGYVNIINTFPEIDEDSAKRALGFSNRISDGIGTIVTNVSKLDIGKADKLKELFREMTEFNKSLGGNVDRLAEVLAEKLVPVLEDLNEALDGGSEEGNWFTRTLGIGKKDEEVAQEKQQEDKKFDMSGVINAIKSLQSEIQGLGTRTLSIRPAGDSIFTTRTR